MPDPMPRPLGVSSLPPPPARPRRSSAPPPAPQASSAEIVTERSTLLPPPPRRASHPEQGTRPDLPASLADLELEDDDDSEDSTLELIARAEQMKPARVPPRVPDLSEAAGADMFARAQRAELDGDHDLAFRLYKEASEAPSHAASARLAYGRLERALGRRQRAISTYKEALHFTGDRALTACLYAELGQLYWAMGEDEEADYYHRRAAALDPSLGGLRRERAESDIHELNTKDLDLARIG